MTLAAGALEKSADLALDVVEGGGRERGGGVGRGPRRRRLARPPPEQQAVEQRVAAQPVGAVHRDAAALAGGEEVLGERAAAVDVDLDAAHEVVRRGPDRDGLVAGVDPGDVHRQLAHLQQARADLLGADRPQVEQDEAVDAAPRGELLGLGARHDVAAGQLHLVGRVAGHEALAVGIDEDAALAPAALGDQHAVAQAGGVELHELEVHERQTGAKGDRGAVAGTVDRVRRALVDAARRTGGEDHGLCAELVQTAVADVDGDHAGGAIVVHRQARQEPLFVDLDAALEALLVERVQNDEARDVGRVGGARVAGAAERPLGDRAVLVAAEGAAHVLEGDQVAGRLAGHDLDGVLVAEVVGALDGVEHVSFPGVVVAEGAVDAALGAAGMAAHRVHLGDEGDVGARVAGRDGGPQAGQAGADDEHVVLGQLKITVLRGRRGGPGRRRGSRTHTIARNAEP